MQFQIHEAGPAADPRPGVQQARIVGGQVQGDRPQPLSLREPEALHVQPIQLQGVFYRSRPLRFLGILEEEQTAVNTGLLEAEMTAAETRTVECHLKYRR